MGNKILIADSILIKKTEKRREQIVDWSNYGNEVRIINRKVRIF